MELKLKAGKRINNKDRNGKCGDSHSTINYIRIQGTGNPSDIPSSGNYVRQKMDRNNAFTEAE